MKRITLLIPVFNEEKNLVALHNELERVTKTLPSYLFTYLFVDDGSKDGSVAILESLAERDEKIRFIELSKNFGKEVALTAGIDAVTCDAVLIMDADLQHPPALIPEFLKKWEEGFEIVATKRREIENRPLMKRMGSHLFYRILNAISDTEMISQTTDFRLLDKIVVCALQSFTERNRMVRGLIDWMGFKKTYIDFSAPERTAGEAGYTYGKLIRLAMNSFTSFSLFPLRIAGYLGIGISCVFGLLFMIMGIDKLLFNIGNFTPIAFVIVVNSFLIGLVLMCLGLIALYIGNIHIEVINRPLYIIRKTNISTNPTGRPDSTR